MDHYRSIDDSARSDKQIVRPFLRLLLVCPLLFCACHKRPPSPWTHDSLRVEVVYPGGGGGGPMEVYEGNIQGGGFSGSDNYSASESYRIGKVAEKGITLEVDIKGRKISQTGEPTLFHVQKSLFVPYEGEIVSLPLIDDRLFRTWFIPNETRPGASTPAPFETGFHVRQENDTFAQMGLETKDFVGTWRSQTGADYELRADFMCKSTSTGSAEEGTWKLEPPNKLVLLLSTIKEFRVSPMLGEKQLFVIPSGGKADIWLQVK
jgi:hypothetical protein